MLKIIEIILFILIVTKTFNNNLIIINIGLNIYNLQLFNTKFHLNLNITFQF